MIAVNNLDVHAIDSGPPRIRSGARLLVAVVAFATLFGLGDIAEKNAALANVKCETAAACEAEAWETLREQITVNPAKSLYNLATR